MRQIPFSSVRRYVLYLTVAIIIAGLSYQAGLRRIGVGITPSKGVVVNSQTPPDAPVDFSIFWEVWNRVHQNYIDASEIDNQKLVWGAVGGMVSALGDPYSSFFPPKENQDFKNELMGGQFEGIGAQLDRRDNRIIVIPPLKGSPAEKAGIRPQDYIMKVDGSETVNWTLQEAVTKIRGPKGSTVVLTVLRNTEEKPADVSIVRDTITVPAITVWVKTPSEISEISGIPENVRTLKNRRVGYIHLTRFGDRLQTEWPKAVDDIAGEITKGTVAGMILDLRNNPGGYLDGSVYIGSEFLKPQTLIVSQKNSDGSKEEYKVNRPGKLLSVPMVVIINKGSASASEIVAGALKDHKRATVIGETSFGKGSVQTPFDLSGGSGVHITTGKWLTPAGESIMKTGIVPDFEVIQENNDATRDAQLVKALEMILK